MIVKSGTDLKIEHFKKRLGFVGDVYVIDHYICDKLHHQTRFPGTFAQEITIMEKEARGFLINLEKSNNVSTIKLIDNRSEQSKKLGFNIGFCTENAVYDFSDQEISNINIDDFIVIIVDSTWKYNDAGLTIKTGEKTINYDSYALTLEQEIGLPIFRTVSIVCYDDAENPKHLIFEVRNYE